MTDSSEMTLLSLAARLTEMAAERGDQTVFYGSYYQDRAVTEVVWENGYPLIIGPDRPSE